MTWLAYQDYLNFKQSELTNAGIRHSDFFENMLHPYAVRLGYQAWFSSDSPWVLDTSIQIRNLCGAVMIEDSLAEVLNWLNEQARSIRSFENAVGEKRVLETEASQSVLSGGLSRL